MSTARSLGQAPIITQPEDHLGCPSRDPYKGNRWSHSRASRPVTVSRWVSCTCNAWPRTDPAPHHGCLSVDGQKRAILLCWWEKSRQGGGGDRNTQSASRPFLTKHECRVATRPCVREDSRPQLRPSQCKVPHDKTIESKGVVANDGEGSVKELVDGLPTDTRTRRKHDPTY